MVEFEGNMFNHDVSILIDPRDSLIYISPKITEACYLQENRFKSQWLVQLATKVKRRVSTKIDSCPIMIADQPITCNSNILPLGSYNIFIGMDWLKSHWSLVNCDIKTITYLNDEGF